jgi:hypothetical protein
MGRDSSAGGQVPEIHPVDALSRGMPELQKVDMFFDQSDVETASQDKKEATAESTFVEDAPKITEADKQAFQWTTINTSIGPPVDHWTNGRPLTPAAEDAPKITEADKQSVHNADRIFEPVDGPVHLSESEHAATDDTDYTETHQATNLAAAAIDANLAATKAMERRAELPSNSTIQLTYAAAIAAADAMIADAGMNCPVV